MIDIVERLREYCGSPYCVQLRAEAAAEIERLRAALRPMVEHFNVGGGRTPIGKMLEEARKALEGK